MDQNRKFWVCPIWAKMRNFEGFFKQCLSYWRQPLVKISARSNNIWGSKSPKTSQKGSFYGRWINTKIFNFTATYAILIKLTTYSYLNKVFHLAKSWGVIHRVSEGINKKPLKMSQKDQFFGPISTIVLQ